MLKLKIPKFIKIVKYRRVGNFIRDVTIEPMILFSKLWPKTLNLLQSPL